MYDGDPSVEAMRGDDVGKQLWEAMFGLRVRLEAIQTRATLFANKRSSMTLTDNRKKSDHNATTQEQRIISSRHE